MVMTTHMPDRPNIAGWCCDPGLARDGMCACGGDERVLRAWISHDRPIALAPDMTPAQRAWCRDEVRQCSDATHQPDDSFFDTAPTADVARAVLDGWTDYCRDKGLL